MKLLAILLCLLCFGCASKPKRLNNDELLLLMSLYNLQTSMNIQAMEKSHDRLLKRLEGRGELWRK